MVQIFVPTREVKFINNNSDSVVIKARLDSKVNSALKSVLNKLKISQQEFIEQKVKEFIIENIDVILNGSDKNK